MNVASAQPSQGRPGNRPAGPGPAPARKLVEAACQSFTDLFVEGRLPFYFLLDYYLSGYEGKTRLTRKQVTPVDLFVDPLDTPLRPPFVVVVAGEFGMGKTTLVRKLVDVATGRPSGPLQVYPLILAMLRKE